MEKRMPLSTQANAEDVTRILGPLDDIKVSQILAFKPSLADIEAARFWLQGEGEILSKSGHPLEGVSARIYDLIAPDEEEDGRG